MRAGGGQGRLFWGVTPPVPVIDAGVGTFGAGALASGAGSGPEIGSTSSLPTHGAEVGSGRRGMIKALDKKRGMGPREFATTSLSHCELRDVLRACD